MKGGEPHDEKKRHGRAQTRNASAWSATSGQKFKDCDGEALTRWDSDVICKKPFHKGVMEFGCGQCTPCRINRQRTWVGRLSLELLKATDACFVTLTYDDDHLPEGGYLDKRHVQLWLKRLRVSLGNRKLRFFLVGEYGEKSWRPHYHAILYGVGFAESELISSAWAKGFCHVGTAEPATMSYVSGYVLKKMTKATDRRLDGRPPEFSQMSRRPGIGFDAVSNLVDAYQSVPGAAALKTHGWITPSVRVGPKIYPMGRYISEKLIARLGLSLEQRQAHKQRRMQEVFDKRSTQTTTAYHRERKARVQQQEGKIGIDTATWRKTL